MTARTWRFARQGLVGGVVVCSVVIATAPRVEGGQLSGIKGDDDRVVVNAAEFPWRAIGRLNKGKGFCTGVLVGPRTVLTAAHCLWNPRTGRRVPARYLHFVAGFQRGAYVAHSTADSVRVAKDYRPDGEPGSPDDWAFVRLTEPIGRRTGYFGLAPYDASMFPGGPGPRTVLVQAGYGRDRPYVMTVHFDCRLLGGLPDRPVFGHDCDAVSGDSGGPIFAFRGGAVGIVAMHVATIQGTAGSAGIAVPSFRFADAAATLGVRGSMVPHQAGIPRDTVRYLIDRLGIGPAATLEDSVRAFQAAGGLPVTGRATIDLEGRLVEALREPSDRPR